MKAFKVKKIVLRLHLRCVPVVITALLVNIPEKLQAVGISEFLFCCLWLKMNCQGASHLKGREYFGPLLLFRQAFSFSLNILTKIYIREWNVVCKVGKLNSKRVRHPCTATL